MIVGDHPPIDFLTYTLVIVSQGQPFVLEVSAIDERKGIGRRSMTIAMHGEEAGTLTYQWLPRCGPPP
jgi:hypothetical protein